jgi:hypothetical protein
MLKKPFCHVFGEILTAVYGSYTTLEFHMVDLQQCTSFSEEEANLRQEEVFEKIKEAGYTQDHYGIIQDGSTYYSITVTGDKGVRFWSCSAF